MAYQRVPQAAEIVVHYTMAGNNIVNTYHAVFGSSYAQGDLDQLASACDVQAGNLRADQSSRITYVKTTVRGLDAEFDLTSEDSSNAGVGGQSGSAALPPNVAFCIQRLSGYTGRSARGRVYIAGIPIGFRDSTSGAEDLLTATAADAYKAHVDAFRSAIEAIGAWNAAIVSRYHNNAKREEGVTFQWIVTDYEDKKLDTRRGRISN